MRKLVWPRSRRSRALAIVLPLAAGIVALFLAVTTQAGPPTPPSLDGVPPESLAESGIELAAPEGNPVVSEQTAREIALKEMPGAMPGASVRQAVLVQLRDDSPP